MRAFIGTELLRRLPRGPVDIRDTKLPGFVLRVRPTGQHTYFVNFKRSNWLRLGTTAVLSVVEAREAARDKLADVAKGIDPIAVRKEDARAQEEAAAAAVVEAEQALTFERFVTDFYEPWAIANQKTGAEQTARLRAAFGPVLNGLRLDAITAFDIERWRSARLKADISPATVNRNLNVLRGAFSRALDWNKLSVHPLAKVKASKVDRGGVVRYLTIEETTRLLAAMTARDATRRADRQRANSWRRERGYKTWPEHGIYTDHLAPIIFLALNTGLRRGELFALRWSDVDLAGAQVTVRGEEAKSGQTRYLPLNATAAAALVTWKECAKPETRDAIVFPAADGGPLEDIKKAWAALRKDAKLEAFRFHDCRHDFASRLVMNGVDLNTVRELLGHADIKMVLRYAHLAPEHKAAAVAKLVQA